MNLYLRALAEQLDPRQPNTAWIIDKDHLLEPGDGPELDSTGTVGPSIAPDHLIARLKAKKTDGQKFKMYDDDGELYYTGRIIVVDENGQDDLLHGDEHLAPLDDFGMPNAGCTSIHYYNAEKKAWEAL